MVLLQEVDELVPGFEDGQVGEFEEVMQNVQLLCSQVVVLQGFGLALAQVVDISLQIEPVSQDVLVLGLHVALHEAFVFLNNIINGRLELESSFVDGGFLLLLDLYDGLVHQLR